MKRASRTRAAAPKPVSPSEALAAQLYLSRYQPGENLAEACRRASFKNLAFALNMNASTISTPKQEFETSEQYAARAGRLSSILAADPVVICESLDDNPDVTFTYQADQARFDGSFLKSHNVWRDVKQLGSYRSRTRMGIAATVRSSLEMEYDVRLSIPDNLKGCLSGSYYTYSFRVPFPLAEAPALKGGGRIVFLSRLEAPYVTKEERSGSPTLDNPSDVYNHTLTISARPEKLIVIDAAGREVWSCRVGALEPLQPPTPEGNQNYWISSLDYPTRGYRDNLAGTVAASLSVAPDGKVTDCIVTGSSGSADLDEATCDGWRKRAKFQPASDKDGNPTAGVFNVSKTWGRLGY